MNLKEKAVRARNVFICLAIAISDGMFRCKYKFKFHKRWRISCLADRLTAQDHCAERNYLTIPPEHFCVHLLTLCLIRFIHGCRI